MAFQVIAGRYAYITDMQKGCFSESLTGEVRGKATPGKSLRASQLNSLLKKLDLLLKQRDYGYQWKDDVKSRMP
jgi:hypothetical protein